MNDETQVLIEKPISIPSIVVGDTDMATTTMDATTCIEKSTVVNHSNQRFDVTNLSIEQTNDYRIKIPKQNQIDTELYNSVESQSILNLRQWIIENGGYIHPSIVVKEIPIKDEYGNVIICERGQSG